ncbi:hypothetical protein [Enterococcus sp. LJL51]|uniref:hypothetical protein n=1 Tax=Enterococcus sp. LJL51 TaxID=3416656 RepID=UPI003CF521EF
MLYNKDFLKNLNNDFSLTVPVSDLLQTQRYTYKDILTLINAIEIELDDTLFLKCSISSEIEMDTTNLDNFLALEIDTEWEIPRIEIGSQLICFTDKNNRLLNIPSLSENLVASYSSEDEAKLTIMSKAVYLTRQVNPEIQHFLGEIAQGDIYLSDWLAIYSKTTLRKMIQFLLNNHFVFAVYKQPSKDFDYIEIIPALSWNNLLKDETIEFSEKGRTAFINNHLGVALSSQVQNFK